MSALLPLLSIWHAIWRSEIPRIVKDELFADLEQVGAELRPLMMRNLVVLKAKHEKILAEREARAAAEAEAEAEAEDFFANYRDLTVVLHVPAGEIVYGVHRLEHLGHDYRDEEEWKCIHCGEQLDLDVGVPQSPCSHAEKAEVAS